jgi:predicted dehydrogenase
MGFIAMISTALIGLGNIAWKYDAHNPSAPFALSQAGAILRCGDTVLSGGCSPDAADRADFSAWGGGLPVFEEPQAMLTALKPDLVGICSPTNMHYEHARLCLEAGVRMLWLEKPPAATRRELYALHNLAQAHRATICVNFFRRYLPVYQHLRNALLSDEFGRCRFLQILYSPGLQRNGIHLLDQLFFITEAEDYTMLWLEHGIIDENPLFSVRLSTGQTAIICGADFTYHSNDIHAVCDSGIFSVLHGGKRAVVEQCVPNSIFPGFYELHSIDHSIVNEASIDNYMLPVLEDLIACAASGRQPLSNTATSILAVKLLEEAIGSTPR